MPSDTPPPSSERPTLAFFAGTLRDGLRTRLADGIAAWRRGGAARAARPIQWFSSGISKKRYWRALRESVFCLCPAGHKVQSPRLIEAILAGCIPVVLADRYVLPLGCFADWSTFAVLVPEAEATSVPQRLAAFSSVAINASAALHKDPPVSQISSTRRHVFPATSPMMCMTALSLGRSRLLSTIANPQS